MNSVIIVLFALLFLCSCQVEESEYEKWKMEIKKKAAEVCLENKTTPHINQWSGDVECYQIPTTNT